MSFYVTVNDLNKTVHVPVGGYQNSSEDPMYTGHSLSGQFSFPSFDASASQTNGSDKDNYVVGVGLDFDNFVIPYLKRFYNEDGGNWEVNNLREIAQKLQMFAEILFPKTSPKYDSSKRSYSAVDYHVLHCPVTLDHNIPDMKFNLLWFPSPLLLISDFSQLGTINSKRLDKDT
jgi:hypothetical protein